MIPRQITDQTIIQRTTWEKIMEQVKELWEEGFYITDFDKGDGVYRVVMSKGTGWKGQSIKVGKSFPKEKIYEGWDKGYTITNISHDGEDWIVIMSGIDEVSNQCFVEEYFFDDLEEKIKEYWDKGYTISCIAYDDLEGFVCVFSKSNYRGQGYRFLKGHFNIKEMENFKKSDGYLITEISNFYSGLFCVASSHSGFSQQRIHREETWERMSELTHNRWDEGYNITTLDYYDGEWYAIFSK